MRVPQGLAGLLGKLIHAGEAGQAKHGEAVSKKGLEGHHGKDEKGRVLVDERVLAGLGYNGADKTGTRKNVAEKENLARFLQDPNAEVEKLLNKDAKTDAPAEDKKGAEAGREPAAKETREAQQKEARREERADEARAQAREAEQVREQRETREAESAREREQERERDRRQGEGHGHGHGHDERQQEDEREPQGGASEEGAIGEMFRCKGTLEDGSRCLRKPMEGAPYCREHAHAGGVDRI